jgi:hypothetical protein
MEELKLNNRYLGKHGSSFIQEILILEITEKFYKIKNLSTNKIYWDFKDNFKTYKIYASYAANEFVIHEDLGEYKEEKKIIPLNENTK